MASIIGVETLQHTNGTTAATIDSSGNLDLANKAGQVLEVLAMNCDGESYVVKSGTYTSTNVTTHQGLTTTYADVNGSSVNYTPPAGTKAVVYEFNFHCRGVDAHGITHMKFYVDGSEVVYARTNISGNSAHSGRHHFRHVVSIGGTANSNTGRLASWSGAKVLKMTAREYGSSNEMNLHQTTHWDGGGSNQFIQPTLTITAIG